MIGRLVAAGGALACGIALALSLGPAKAEQRASRVAFDDPKLVRGETFTTALADARAARRLAPDVPAKLVEWQLLFANGQDGRAERMLREITREEPSNAIAWVIVANRAADERLAREARRRLRELNPLYSARGG